MASCLSGPTDEVDLVFERPQMCWSAPKDKCTRCSLAGIYKKCIPAQEVELMVTGHAFISLEIEQHGVNPSSCFYGIAAVSLPLSVFRLNRSMIFFCSILSFFFFSCRLKKVVKRTDQWFDM